MNWCIDIPMVDGNTQVLAPDYDALKVPLATQNGSAKVYSNQLHLKGKIYKLVIQIDKIRAKPGPKCKKPALLAASRREKIGEVRGPFVNLPKERSEKPAHIQDEPQPIRNQCPVCQEYHDSVLELVNHQETAHSVCPLCSVPFASKLVCDEHTSQHLKDSLTGYICHLCQKGYDSTRNLKVHITESHREAVDIGGMAVAEEVEDVEKVTEMLVYECAICNVTLEDDEAYRTHLTLHEMSVDAPVPKPPERISEMHLNDQQNLKLTCTVCSQTFDTAVAAERHTCSLKFNEPKVCTSSNIKKVHSNEVMNQRLASHLSRAHHCKICRKVYINRTTLLNHMRIHEK